MSRPVFGTDLQQLPESESLPFVEGMEFRDDNGLYWRQESDGFCHAIGTPITWQLSRVVAASTGPVIVTYIPPVPSPHTRPGHYVCSGACAYRFYLREDGLWEGPWRPEGPPVHTKPRPMKRWWELEDEYGDCTRNLVGPVPETVLKGY